jgi:carboxymethylenebutenolidase
VGDFERYIVEEHIEDFNDGLISRRELLRRVTMITGSTAAAFTMLAALGCNPNQPRAGTEPTSTAAAAAATPPASSTTDGVTVRPDDPRIRVERADIKGPDGAALMSYLARPSGSGRFPGVLVVHENRGLLEHIKDVVRRVATAGFVGVAIDVLSRQGGAERLSDQAAYNAELAKRSADDMVKDERAALDYLKTQNFADGARLAATGFCFGGGVVWNVVNSGADLRAAVPFYGPAPANPSGLATTKTAVLGVYAEQDTRINADIPKVEEQLKKSGTPYRITTFPGVNHAFHNDTGQRYNADQAQRAWTAAIEWIRQYTA